MILKFHTPSNRATKHKTKQDFKKKSIHLPKTEGFLLSVSQILVNQEDKNQLTIEILKSKLKGLSNGFYNLSYLTTEKCTYFINTHWTFIKVNYVVDHYTDLS